MAVLPSKTPITSPTSQQQPIEDIINSPHIGYIKDPSNQLEVFVIGTSHFRCSSAAEVTSLIQQVQPDGVVLELDPERVLRLTKQYFGFDAHDAHTQIASTTTSKGEELLYGSDFVAAVTTCQEMDIPLFLGDEYAQETKRRLIQQLFRVEAYSPIPLVNSLLPQKMKPTQTKIPTLSRVSLIDSFRTDPKKLTPLAVSSSPPLVVSALALLFHNNEAAASIVYTNNSGAVLDGVFNVLETSISIFLSFFVSCFLFNTVIVERDEILADSTIRAWNVLRSLKDGTFIRKRWEFRVNTNKNETPGSNSSSTSSSLDAKTAQQQLPLFTLKTPLIKGKRRNLNLFEPRWLKMIDSVTATKKDYTSSSSPQFGCVRCTNKFYCAASINGIEGRYADIIFERKGTLASIVELKEGKRPISGDRKIGVTIEGSDEFIIDDELSSISVTEDGYMIAKKWDNNDDLSKPSIQRKSDEWVRVVVVVGLLHGNGVVKLLSKC
jgi:Lon protease-like protein